MLTLRLWSTQFWTWWAYIFDSTSLKEVWISLFWLYLQIAREAAQTRGTRTHHWHIWSHLWGTFTLGHGSCQPQFSSQGQWPGNFKNHDAECSLTPCADAHSGRFLGSDGRQATKTTEEEHLLKIEKMVLPKHNAVCLAHEPKNGPMRILTAAVWLKLWHKYFNQGIAKEACQLFNVQVKQLLRVLTGRKYLGGGDKKETGPKTRGKKWKSVTSSSEMKKVKTKEDNDDDNNTSHQKVKDRPHWLALIWEHLHICQLDNLNATCPTDKP